MNVVFVGVFLQTTEMSFADRAWLERAAEAVKGRPGQVRSGYLPDRAALVLLELG
jgi:hypothetical protein